MSMTRKILPIHILEKKKLKERFVMLTAYDAPSAKLLDEVGISIILVGDSLGNVVLGYENTVPVTMEDMIHHTKAVRRGCKASLIVADMPFLSYHISLEEAKRHAGRLIQEGGAQAVKVEVGEAEIEVVKAIVGMGIPVMAHIGFTPQSVYQQGGYRVQGRTESEQERILDLAKRIEDAGAFSIVLEMVPASFAQTITETIGIPTIGIGAGLHCDGQVLVTQDLLGMLDKKPAKFVKQYAQLHDVMKSAVAQFKTDVENGQFPDLDHQYA